MKGQWIDRTRRYFELAPPPKFDLPVEMPNERSADSPERTENADALRAVHIRTPPFLRTNPDAWFLQLESTFACQLITSDKQKYHLAVAALDGETMQDLIDVLRTVPEQGRFEYLRSKILSRYTDTEQKKLHHVLNNLSLGSLSPSELLRRMRALAGTSLDETALKVRWLDLLPSSTARTLRVLRNSSLNELAEVADDLLEASPDICSVQAAGMRSRSPVRHVPAAVPAPRPAEPVYGHTSGGNEELALLRASIAQFTLAATKMAETISSAGGVGRSRSSSRSRARGRSATPGPSTGMPALCYYHQRFGDAAKNCRPPCSRFSGLGN